MSRAGIQREQELYKLTEQSWKEDRHAATGAILHRAKQETD